MSKPNPLAGLIGQYGESDDDSEDEKSFSSKLRPDVDAVPVVAQEESNSNPAVHPAPVQHCPWSACYDENSGFTYYWNQYTNAVTWEAPPEYLLALKVAQQQLHIANSSEVSAEEWQLYQQALAEKQNAQSKATKVVEKPAVTNGRATEQKPAMKYAKNGKLGKKRGNSESEDEKIELITSYYNSESDSNDESVSPEKVKKVKKPVQAPPQKPVQAPPQKPVLKKQKTKSQHIEYGPSLPPNYSAPIGPELPPALVTNESKIGNNIETPVDSPKDKKANRTEEEELYAKLKDKTKLLEKLGGEVPIEVQNIMKEDLNSSRGESPATLNEESTRDTAPVDSNIDDLLDEIEKKQFAPKSKNTIDMFTDAQTKDSGSGKSTPKELSRCNSPTTDVKPLFPIALSNDEPKPLFPSSANIVELPKETKQEITDIVAEKKGSNMYLSESQSEVVVKKKLRLSNSVLPERKTSEVPSYTTKYSQLIEGFSGEKTGLGFSRNDDDKPQESSKKTISYGKGLMFTKGETLNEEKKDVVSEDLIDLLDCKLKFLTHQQMYPVAPVQEMHIQMQTLLAAYRANALKEGYISNWIETAADSLKKLEDSAAPQGWSCQFNRVECRYDYRRECDGFVQCEYPTEGDDMDICTTPPPPPAVEEKLPVVVAPPPPPPPRVATPPPPPWADPPPPGCDEQPEPKKEIGDELQSFYNDLAEIEKTSTPPTGSNSNSPERPKEQPPLPPEIKADKEKDVKVSTKKKTKVKISTSMGLKHKSVSSLVAKWQQVAEEINSD